MPQIADLIVKASNGTTDVTFNAMSPSSGDRVAAVWMANGLSTTPLFRPRFEHQTRWNTARDARRHDMLFVMPFESSVQPGQKAGEIVMSSSIVVPRFLVDGDTANALAYAVNLPATALVKSLLLTGFSAT